MPQEVLLAVRLDQRDALVASAREPEVLDRRVVYREEAAGRAVLRRHVPERGAVRKRERRDAFAEVLDELPDNTHLAETLGHREHEVGGGRALPQLSGELEADHLRHQHRERLAEHRSLGLDAADAPAQDTEPVDHRRVRVGADERIGEGDAVPLVDDTCQELEVDLMADSRSRRHHGEVVERLLPPAQEGVALAVAGELELDVARECPARGKQVDLHRVVDHQLGRDQRVDAPRITTEIRHGVAHRGEIDDRGDARQVLEKDAGRCE